MAEQLQLRLETEPGLMSWGVLAVLNGAGVVDWQQLGSLSLARWNEVMALMPQLPGDTHTHTHTRTNTHTQTHRSFEFDGSIEEGSRD